MVLTDFVDDMTGGARTAEAAWIKLEKVVRFFLSVGVPVSDKPNGIKPPAQR